MGPLTQAGSPAATAVRSTTRCPSNRALAAPLLALLALAFPAVSAFDLQAHRGGRGLMPENTLPAFEHALSLGVNTLELDIAMTA